MTLKQNLNLLKTKMEKKKTGLSFWTRNFLLEGDVAVDQLVKLACDTVC
jgi:hypothetical protein